MSVLYHYTSQIGLVGILRSRGIWATQTHFLNDSSEFRHALQTASRIASVYYYDDDYYEAFGWELQRGVRRISGDDIYVASFSERPDLLSQWRGYCPAGSGVCIGFDVDSLNEYCVESGYSLQRCIYEPSEQDEKIKELVDACLLMFPSDGVTREEFASMDVKSQIERNANLHAYFSAGAGTDSVTAALDWFCNELSELAPLFKNSGFHEEAEWRIIAKAPKSTINFRPGSSYVIPYIDLEILGEPRTQSIRDVIVGPNPNQHRCKKSLEIMFQSLGFSEAKVSSSSIPFNNW